MLTFLQEVRYAVRQLRKSPGFAALAVVTLALGIGANTAIFTVIESVLLRPLPYQHSDRMVYVGPADADGFQSTSWITYRDVREQAQKLVNVALFSEDVGVVQGKEGSVSVVTPGVTPSVFKLLGVQPLLGRTFTEDEGQTGGPQVVLLSEGLWRQAFNADPAIAGKTIRVNGKPRTVVGVMSSGFRFPETMGQDLQKGLWLPIQATTEMQKDRGSHFFYIVAGLKPGVTLDQGQAELAAIAQHIHQIDPEKGKDIAFRITNYHEMLTRSVREVFLALVIGLGLVLLILLILHRVADRIAAHATERAADRRTGARMAHRGADYRARAGAQHATTQRALLTCGQRLPAASGQPKGRDQYQCCHRQNSFA